jgi:hypothetical protein
MMQKLNGLEEATLFIYGLFNDALCSWLYRVEWQDN